MPLYACTIFLSAFLLFQVQPLIAKAILPWFGGSASVWTTCLLFFQMLLLVGYLYSHWAVRRLSPRVQGIVHLALLGASLLVLPITPDPVWKPFGGEEPIFRILGLLTVTVGLPYFLLSTTTPLLQAWYVRAEGSAFPYRLFALSNLGSMLALLSYPTLVEPRLPTGQQELLWSIGYLLFAALAAFSALRTRSGKSEEGEVRRLSGQDAGKPEAGILALWLALAACPSILLLSVTSHLSRDVAPIPFLWVLTLSLYLLSFILTFESDRWYRRWLFFPLLAAALGGIAWFLSDEHRTTDLRIIVSLFSGGLFAACMVCHGELAHLKPHPRHLTSFYLMCSLGGALGGIFVGILAPGVFSTYFELQIGMVACAFLSTYLFFLSIVRPALRFRTIAWGTLGVLCLLSTALGIVLFGQIRQRTRDSRVLVRNFYGGLRVKDHDEGEDAYRSLRHGIIIHGEQYLSGEKRRDPLTYYSRNSGVGLAILHCGRRGPQRIGVVGLGAGTLASYGRPGDVIRYYEINPAVPKIATKEFTYLKDSPAKVEVILGDARLSLEREEDQHYDVLAIDAFSSDAIPMHLLTREAFALYSRHLKRSGVLAVHISNKYLDLEPIVYAASRELGKVSCLVEAEEIEGKEVFHSSWALLSSHRGFFQISAIRKAATPLHGKVGFHMWTDDYSNLLQIVEK